MSYSLHDIYYCPALLIGLFVFVTFIIVPRYKQVFFLYDLIHYCPTFFFSLWHHSLLSLICLFFFCCWRFHYFFFPMIFFLLMTPFIIVPLFLSVFFLFVIIIYCSTLLMCLVLSVTSLCWCVFLSLWHYSLLSYFNNVSFCHCNIIQFANRSFSLYDNIHLSLN